MTKRATERRLAYALALGILLFSVAMLQWGHHEATFAFWEHEFCLPWLYSVYGATGDILLALSVVPMMALFSERVERWLERFLENRPTSPPQAVAQFALWLCTSWVFLLEWTKGLSAVSGNERYSYVVLIVGLVWLCVLLGMFVRPSFQRMMQQFRSSSPV